MQDKNITIFGQCKNCHTITNHICKKSNTLMFMIKKGIPVNMCNRMSMSGYFDCPACTDIIPCNKCNTPELDH